MSLHTQGRYNLKIFLVYKIGEGVKEIKGMTFFRLHELNWHRVLFCSSWGSTLQKQQVDNLSMYIILSNYSIKV
jgi:hypothetical protein